MTFALVQGGAEHLGWGTDREMIAALFDAINTNTRASGNWKGKPPTLPSFPRPGDQRAEGKPNTVASLFASISAKG